MAKGGNFSNGGYQQNNNGNQQQKKRSGSRTGMDKKGRRYTTGWNKSKGAGFVKFLCIETSNSVKSESKTGNKYLSVMVKVQHQMQPEMTTNGLMNIATGKVYIQSMNVVLNPKAPNGGYCGKVGK